MEPIITFVTLVAGVVTIAWFIWDMRKENSKVLKRQEATLLKIEEGQRKGFKTLSDDFKTLSEGQLMMAKILENSQKILERIEANTRN